MSEIVTVTTAAKSVEAIKSAACDIACIAIDPARAVVAPPAGK